MNMLKIIALCILGLLFALSPVLLMREPKASKKVGQNDQTPNNPDGPIIDQMTTVEELRLWFAGILFMLIVWAAYHRADIANWFFGLMDLS